MKLICTQENLSRSITYLERITGKQSTLPILSNILIEAENGRLKLSATNLEIGVIVNIGAKIEEEGKITIPAKLIGSFIHNLPSGDILNLQTEQSSLVIQSTQYEGKIKGMDGKDFPIIPCFQGEEYPFVFPAQFFKNALSQILFCVSQNESRMELTGVNVSFEEKFLYLAATDSFRLAEQTFELPYETPSTQSFIIPSATCQELLRIITQESKEVFVAIEENQAFFEVDGVKIVSRLIHGKYPDYKQIIPISFLSTYQIKREELVRAVKITSVLSSYNAGEITIRFTAGSSECSIEAVSQEVGQNKARVRIENQSGEDLEQIFTFNPRYVLEGLNAFKGEYVVFHINNATSPVVLREKEGEKEKAQYFYIMMPVRK
ncbi:MAG: DNA polymerase III subunit beta [Candidatus Moranbacteria bacterium]|jgi:DNA polymerase-3 subunit beta|nr:DNA polymerase III subunit beta [Candidatus Moranbacteria bacterium]MBP9801309.1 DNA polymerase III subunit beta [Candidatus Moranbacteria bacterium]